MITFDTYAWVELLNGSEKGQVVKQYVDDPDNVIFTPTICLAELKVRMMKEARPEKAVKKALDKVFGRSMLMQLDSDIALKAADFKSEGLPLADAIIYATALRTNTKLLTGDKHFESMPSIQML